MALDSNIAMGVRGIELQNPLAQYGQIAAIQNAQNQNALAQFQLGSAQRQEQTQNALSESYRNSINPETGQLDPKKLISNVAQSNAAHMLPDIQAKLLESQTKEATLKKTGVETSEKEFKLAQDKLKHGWMSMGEASTPQAAIEKLQDGVKQGYFDFATASAEAQKIQNMTPDQYKQYRIQKVMGLLDAKDQLGAMLPKVARQEAGGKVVSIQDNPMLPGYGLPVAGMDITKTATIGEITGQGQLGLAKQKFAWEQANPGFELKEAEDGSIVGVNKRTLQAFPVTVGGAAPAAPAATPAGAGMPSARVPAIPGMASVLDQQAPAATATAAKPLMGKGTAMSESQSNAAMFGGAMAQAQNTIKQLEKSGTVKNAVVPGLLTGLAQMVPFGVGEGVGNVIQSTFNADPTGLIGPNAEQQKLAQAQLAFATAYLRKTSGASFGASEVSNTIKEFFPLIGEGKDVIAQKAAARERAIEGMKISTNKEGKKYIENYGGGSTPTAAGGGGVDLSNPLLRTP
ncbi:hypothetical protein UFOVP173_32 [uncultured Caudovirales phage]|uniref:Uncharacterized protein n=1 Tax=uncultured Caudovirales phage TaxID=2100421 RepID=A0A6J7WBF8_9CAUD|nr:hypothetical protein UFOVP173_32 [uncultured Caudovirales phage]